MCVHTSTWINNVMQDGMHVKKGKTLINMKNNLRYFTRGINTFAESKVHRMGWVEGHGYPHESNTFIIDATSYPWVLIPETKTKLVLGGLKS